MLAEEMPLRLHPVIKRMSETKLLKVMDMMKVRMRYIADIRNHGYFFELPNYQTDLGKGFIKKLK